MSVDDNDVVQQGSSNAALFSVSSAAVGECGDVRLPTDSGPVAVHDSRLDGPLRVPPMEDVKPGTLLATEHSVARNRLPLAAYRSSLATMVNSSGQLVIPSALLTGPQAKGTAIPKAAPSLAIVDLPAHTIRHIEVPQEAEVLPMGLSLEDLSASPRVRALRQRIEQQRRERCQQRGVLVVRVSHHVLQCSPASKHTDRGGP